MESGTDYFTGTRESFFLHNTGVQLYLHIQSLNYMLVEFQFNFVDIFF